MDLVRFRIDISREQMLSYYGGAANQISTRADDGRVIRFPAQWLRPHVGTDGVHGRFEMRFDEQHKLIDLKRVGD